MTSLVLLVVVGVTSFMGVLLCNGAGYASAKDDADSVPMFYTGAFLTALSVAAAYVLGLQP